jgi:hypothetical protein
MKQRDSYALVANAMPDVIQTILRMYNGQAAESVFMKHSERICTTTVSLDENWFARKPGMSKNRGASDDENSFEGGDGVWRTQTFRGNRWRSTCCPD